MFSWHVVALIDEETCKMQHFLTLALASSTAEVVSLSNQLIALNIIKDLSALRKVNKVSFIDYLVHSCSLALLIKLFNGHLHKDA